MPDCPICHKVPVIHVPGRLYPDFCSECEKKVKYELDKKGILSKMVRQKKITKKQAEI